MTVFAAPSIELKEHTAEEILSGIPNSFRETSLIIPKVPSDPTNNLVRSYPAADFLALFEVLVSFHQEE